MDLIFLSASMPAFIRTAYSFDVCRISIGDKCLFWPRRAYLHGDSPDGRGPTTKAAGVGSPHWYRARRMSRRRRSHLSTSGDRSEVSDRRRQCANQVDPPRCFCGRQSVQSDPAALATCIPTWHNRAARCFLGARWMPCLQKLNSNTRASRACRYEPHGSYG